MRFVTFMNNNIVFAENIRTPYILYDRADVFQESYEKLVDTLEKCEQKSNDQDVDRCFDDFYCNFLDIEYYHQTTIANNDDSVNNIVSYREIFDEIEENNYNSCFWGDDTSAIDIDKFQYSIMRYYEIAL